MEIVEYADRDMMAIDLASRLAGELRAALSHRDRVLFAVPGGSTPGPVFDALCAAQIAWDSVDVLLTDERWVRPDHPRSNTRLVRERLLVDRAAAARLLPMYQPTDTPEAAVARVTEAILPHLPISVLLLGMGEDGHVASLFPGSDRLDAALAEDAPPVMALRAPAVDEARLTLTRPVLDGALSKHLAITGEAKRDVLERASRRSETDAPVRAVMGGLTVHWAV